MAASRGWQPATSTSNTSNKKSSSVQSTEASRARGTCLRVSSTGAVNQRMSFIMGSVTRLQGTRASSGGGTIPGRAGRGRTDSDRMGRMYKYKSGKVDPVRSVAFQDPDLEPQRLAGRHHFPENVP